MKNKSDKSNQGNNKKNNKNNNKNKNENNKSNKTNISDKNNRSNKNNKSDKSNKSIQDKSILNIIYMMLTSFILVIGYFTYFLVVERDDFINNAYNKRHDVLATRVVRGDILSSNGDVLATTKILEDGTENRYYPYNNMFAHIVGRHSKGRTGIEESENIRLLTAQINSVENLFNELRGRKNYGNNIVTTLNLNLQKVAYDALGDNKGAVVVLEPSTGKILAMVSKPDYNPNDIDRIWDSVKDDNENSVLVNRAAQGKYPPGSTFKILTALGYIRHNQMYLEYEYECLGKISIEDMTIHCYNNKVHGKINLKDAFALSCNTFFAHMGTLLDPDEFYLLSEDFYFNKVFPINIISNSSSYALKKDNFSNGEAMQTAIGQGLSLITPLHNAMIVATVANKGVMMKPYVVDAVTNAKGNVIKENKAVEIANPMTIMESAVIGSMLREVVLTGTAKELKNINVEVAGKTGSAEQAGKPAHAWFVGYAPFDDPSIAIAVIVESKGTGSSYAVPIAKKVISAYFD